jgi:hypothetical protein
MAGLLEEMMSCFMDMKLRRRGMALPLRKAKMKKMSPSSRGPRLRDYVVLLFARDCVSVVAGVLAGPRILHSSVSVQSKREFIR